jgi:hypothetical protein
VVSEGRRFRCHLLWASGDSWDLELSLLSLVGQQGAGVAVVVHAPGDARGAAAESCARLAPLSEAVTFSVAGADPTLAAAGDEAVTVWTAGTLATSDHFVRAMDVLGRGANVAVAGARRMRLLRRDGEPPYVVQKTWRWTPRHPTLASLAADPAFLGRCVIRRDAAPADLALEPKEHRAWARRLWEGSTPVRIAGFPSIDLPDLRPEGAATGLDDRLAELRYQLPRRLERAAPLTFTRARALFHALRGLSVGGRG